MVSLRTYRAKRDFTKTAEPAGTTRRAAKRAKTTTRSLSFVVQRHAARRLHFDFRLEHRGVLLSWAVPKEPSMDPAVRRLAIRTEDHPLEYGSFEGTIPRGAYGAGKVGIWDHGTWRPAGDVDAGLRKGHLTFTLRGSRLRGRFHLTRIDRDTATGNGVKAQWLLVKAREDDASPAASAATKTRRGRTRSARATPKSDAKRNASRSTARAASREPAALDDSPTSRSPRTFRRPGRRRTDPVFCLATLVDTVPAGPEWVHETKFDGYRVMLRVDDGRCRVITRGGNDWSDRFATVASAAAKLRVESAMIDGEIVVLDESGHSRFERLQGVLAGELEAPLVFHAFDVLELNGEDLRPLPLSERKRVLAKLLARARDPLRLTPALAEPGPAAWKKACELGLEGIVSKRLDRPYRGGRGLDWVKTKCVGRQEFVIGGYTSPRGERMGFGALLLGVYEGARLRFCGRVGTGFSNATMHRLIAQLRTLERESSPFVDAPRSRDAHWVEPELVCEVGFTAWTRDGRLRHPSFVGLRADKAAQDIVRERAKSPSRSARASSRGPTPGTRASPRASRSARVIALDDTTRLTHADKVLFPGSKVTKGDLAAYLAAIAPRMLPFVAGRPLALVRCPDGIGKECFFQKHARGGSGPIVVRDARDLVALAQLGAIEIHPWGSTQRALERPDVLVLDLDPGPGVPWKDVVALAHAIRRLLRFEGLESYAKLTGGKGIHVVVPTRGGKTWTEHKRWAKELATRIAALAPDRLTTALRKDQREGRIFIDYLRNGRGATAIAPYSPRARPGAPVACPVSWKELTPALKSDAFGFDRAIERARRDPWRGYFDAPSRTSKPTKADRVQ